MCLNELVYNSVGVGHFYTARRYTSVVCRRRVFVCLCRLYTSQLVTHASHQTVNLSQVSSQQSHQLLEK